MKRNYNDPLYSKWRSDVYKRDNHKCQMPGCKSKKSRLNAHHIKMWAHSPAARYEVSNGITLCWRCHKEVTGKEKYYESLFNEIVYKNGKKI